MSETKGFLGHQLLSVCHGKSQEIRASGLPASTVKIHGEYYFVCYGWLKAEISAWKYPGFVKAQKTSIQRNTTLIWFYFFLPVETWYFLRLVDCFWYRYILRQTATFPVLVQKGWSFKIPQKLKMYPEFISSDFSFTQIPVLHNNEDCLHKIDIVIFTAEKNPEAKFKSPLKMKHRTLALGHD